MTAPNETTLDRRRAKAQAAKEAADAAKQRVSALDDRLVANGTQAQEHETALRQARDEVARQKKAIRASAKLREQLQRARKNAEASAAKARRKAHAAEDKYDKAVLAEMVRREKDQDRAGHRQQPAGSGTGEPADATMPAPERPAGGATSATQTAARKTADRAAVSADHTGG